MGVRGVGGVWEGVGGAGSVVTQGRRWLLASGNLRNGKGNSCEITGLSLLPWGWLFLHSLSLPSSMSPQFVSSPNSCFQPPLFSLAPKPHISLSPPPPCLPFSILPRCGLFLPGPGFLDEGWWPSYWDVPAALAGPDARRGCAHRLGCRLDRHEPGWWRGAPWVRMLAGRAAGGLGFPPCRGTFFPDSSGFRPFP